MVVCDFQKMVIGEKGLVMELFPSGMTFFLMLHQKRTEDLPVAFYWDWN